jgi:dihydrofolate reductase
VAELVYTAIASLDGFVADEDGTFDWSAPDPQVHTFINDLERPIGTYLYGRRIYEVMSAWESVRTGEPALVDYARLWRAADKIVYSRTLPAVTTGRTSLERAFDPGAVRRIKDDADREISVAGPTLAGAALAAGLVDEIRLFLSPILVGGGLAALPRGTRHRLALLDSRRFDAGVQYLRYRVEQ